jgi:predicted DNA binding CopG/RHH family protein
MKKNEKMLDNLILDKYEQEIEDSIPKNFNPVLIDSKEQKSFVEVAKKHIESKLSKRINIRIKNEDLMKVKAKAIQNNIPYQTLLSALIHKYAKNDIKLSI